MCKKVHEKPYYLLIIFIILSPLIDFLNFVIDFIGNMICTEFECNSLLSGYIYYSLLIPFLIFYFVNLTITIFVFNKISNSSNLLSSGRKRMSKRLLGILIFNSIRSIISLLLVIYFFIISSEPPIEIYIVHLVFHMLIVISSIFLIIICSDCRVNIIKRKELNGSEIIVLQCNGDFNGKKPCGFIINESGSDISECPQCGGNIVRKVKRAEYEDLD